MLRHGWLNKCRYGSGHVAHWWPRGRGGNSYEDSSTVLHLSSDGTQTYEAFGNGDVYCSSSIIYFLFTLYTDDCKSDSVNTYILKFSDVLLSLLGSEDDLSMHQYCIDRLVEWCERNSLVINEKKTEEIIFGLPENMYQTRVTIHNTQIEIVSAHKYLGVYVDAALSWSAHIEYVCCKVQQRIYFLRRLRSFGANKQISLMFFQSVIQCCTIWNMCLV